MGVNDFVFGQPGQTQVHQAPGTRPPGYNFAQNFFNSLSGISQNPYPTYGGQVDPGLSPMIQSLLQMSQGYAGSGPSEILQQAQGSLGRFMNPSFANPQARFQGGGMPDYFNQNPSQPVYGGRPAGSFGNPWGRPTPMPTGGQSGSFPPSFGGGMDGSYAVNKPAYLGPASEGIPLRSANGGGYQSNPDYGKLFNPGGRMEPSAPQTGGPSVRPLPPQLIAAFMPQGG